MKLEQIKIFLELSKELHFWRTADRVHITQSALSRQIQALEVEVGFPLFVRNKRTVKLTAAGEFFRDEWTRTLEEIEDFQRKAKQISDGEIGTLRIGHPGSISQSFLPDLLAKTSLKYPSLQYELVEVSATSLEEALLNYKIDVGFNRDTPKNEQLAFDLVGQDGFGLFVPKNHPLANESSGDLKHFTKEKFILPSLKNEGQYAEDLARIFNDYEVTPDTYIESEFGATIVSLVNNGLGISVMPESYSLNLPDGVKFLPLPYRTNLYAVWREYDADAVIRNLIEIVRDV